METINVIIAALVTIFYLMLATRILSSFYRRITNPLNHATGILLIFTLIGFGINLHDFSEIAVSSFFFYTSTGNWFYAISFYLLFALIAFVFSFILFRFSFLLMNMTTPENEKAELGKNNIILALTHGVVYVLLCYILSSPITILANTMIGYSNISN